MALVATLIAHPARRELTDGIVARAGAAVGATRTDWLGAGLACDLFPAPDLTPQQVEASLRGVLGDAPLDVAVQPLATRRKRLLLADMDSTMIDQECIDELADEVGLKDKVTAITARSMHGEIAFEPALRERVALLKGLSESVIPEIIAKRITLASGAKQLVRTMRAHGAWTALVSGGFTAFTGPVAAEIGFDENRANTLLMADGRMLGRVQEPILGREAKAQALQDISQTHGLTPAEAIAVGDGANDLDMIRLAGTGVALHAKPSVAAVAPFRIDHGDLTALLFMQGYREGEFAA